MSMPAKDEGAGDCASCGEVGDEICPKAKRDCGHHCNCSWVHDECCWCGEDFSDIGDDK